MTSLIWVINGERVFKPLGIVPLTVYAADEANDYALFDAEGDQVSNLELLHNIYMHFTGLFN